MINDIILKRPSLISVKKSSIEVIDNTIYFHVLNDFERSDASLYGNRYWDDCFLDKDLKNMYDIRKEYGYDTWSIFR